MKTTENDPRRAWPIRAVIGEHLPLQRDGDRFTARCPYCPAGTIEIFPGKELYACYDCSVGGDVISFVMRTRSLPFDDAVTWLEEWAGNRDRGQ